MVLFLAALQQSVADENELGFSTVSQNRKYAEERTNGIESTMCVLTI